MRFRLDVPDGGGPTVLELDLEGIEYLTLGLARLRGCAAGEELGAPTLCEEDGEPTGAGELVLRRAADPG